jgi:hypothetical protein
MRILVTAYLLLLTALSSADALHLEFAQEGEPNIPRALVVIHNTFEDRSNFKDFLATWADRSWGRQQYCSVYTFEYDANGLSSLRHPREVAAGLYSMLRSDRFEKDDPDPVNPSRRVAPTDQRQPEPSFRSDKLELILAGNGFGGLVAREVALLAKNEGVKVTRVAYLGTPLDGLSTVEMVLAFTVPERAQALGLSRELGEDGFWGLSQAWWHLVELFEKPFESASYFAPAHQEVLCVGGYGTSVLPSHPTDNVLYGRRRKLVRDEKESDGFAPRVTSWGAETGPVPWLVEADLEANHASLTEKSGQFLLDSLLDKEMIHSYLARRENIELLVKGDGELPPIGIYWDERVPSWKEAYASAKARYEMMWGVAP